jgi:hypothetical protein
MGRCLFTCFSCGSAFVFCFYCDPRSPHHRLFHRCALTRNRGSSVEESGARRRSRSQPRSSSDVITPTTDKSKKRGVAGRLVATQAAVRKHIPLGSIKSPPPSTARLAVSTRKESLPPTRLTRSASADPDQPDKVGGDIFGALCVHVHMPTWCASVCFCQCVANVDPLCTMCTVLATNEVSARSPAADCCSRQFLLRVFTCERRSWIVGHGRSAVRNAPRPARFRRSLSPPRRRDTLAEALRSKHQLWCAVRAWDRTKSTPPCAVAAVRRAHRVRHLRRAFTWPPPAGVPPHPAELCTPGVPHR